MVKYKEKDSPCYKGTENSWKSNNDVIATFFIYLLHFPRKCLFEKTALFLFYLFSSRQHHADDDLASLVFYFVGDDFFRLPNCVEIFNYFPLPKFGLSIDSLLSSNTVLLYSEPSFVSTGCFLIILLTGSSSVPTMLVIDIFIRNSFDFVSIFKLFDSNVR